MSLPVVSSGRVRRAAISLLVLITAQALSSFSASATPLLSEVFDYPDGNLVPSGGWVAHSAAGSAPIQVSGGKAYLHQGSGAREDDHRNFSTPATSKVYACFELQVASAPSPGPPVYFAHFRNASSLDFRSRVYVTAVQGGDFTVGISTTVQTSTPVITWPAPLVFGQTYRIVHSYDDSTRTAELWVDPVNESSPRITSSGFGVPSVAMDSYSLRQGGSSPNEPPHTSNEIVDSLGVATTFAEVLGRPLEVSPDLSMSFKCVTDSLGYYCLDHVFPGQGWGVTFAVYNQGERAANRWSYDIDLVDSTTGQRIPLQTQVAGAPIPVGGSAQIHWTSSYLFDESQKGSHWRVEVTAADQDSIDPEPPDRQGNNRASWDFVVRNPASDLAMSFKCVTDSFGYSCLDHVFPAQRWGVSFGVYNQGERAANNWSYDIDLVNPSTGERIPLQTRVAGSPLPVGAFTQFRWMSSYVFDENQKGSNWRVEVTAADRDSINPEPPDHQGNNRASWDFVVRNPVSDLAMAFKCVADSLGHQCRSRVFPGERWTIQFGVYNFGERTIESWSYDIDLVDQGTGERIALARQLRGDSLGVGSFHQIHWSSTNVFEEAQKGTNWRAEVTVAIKDSLNPEPPDRQGNNQASWSFEVDNPIPDIALSYKCVTDSAGPYCMDRVFPGRHWDVVFDVYNTGEKPLSRWSYDIDLINAGTGQRTALVTQAHGDSLPVGAAASIRWPSFYVFDESQKQSAWRVEVTVAVQDSIDPEPPDRLYNNQASWSLRIENPISDIAVGFKCATDSVGYNCLYRVFPGQVWYVQFDVIDAGESPLDSWSYDIDLINQGTGERIPLKVQERGPAIPLHGYTRIRWPSSYVFDESQKASNWRVEVNVAVTDSARQEPPDRRYNNRSSWDFRVESPIVDIAIDFKCIGDSLGFNCTNRVFPGQHWDVDFGVSNRGERLLRAWSYDIDLINQASGQRIPLQTHILGDTIPVGGSRHIHWESSHVFDESQDGSAWRVELNLTADSESPGYLDNNRASWSFVVQGPIPDLGINFKCITDSLGNGCLTRVFPGQHWNVTFGVYNQGERAVENWSYDVVLVQDATGTRIPLKTQVGGGPLPAGGYTQINWVSYYQFDESQKDSTWRVEVSVAVKDSLSPEPLDRQGNNHYSCSFRVGNRVTDIAMVFKCVTDSSNYNCLSRIFPGQPWYVSFTAYNWGDLPLKSWSYGIDLLNQGTGERIPLVIQARGDSILPPGGYGLVHWASPYLFGESDKGSQWQVEVNVAVEDSANPEPQDRQFDNRASSTIQVVNPISDIAVGFKCISDTLGFGCTSRVFPGLPWHVAFDVYNVGDRALESWSYDIDLINQGSGERIPLEVHQRGAAIPVGGYLRTLWASPYLFEESQKGSNWRVEMTAAVRDSAHPEPPDRLYNNQSSWSFEVVNPVADLAVAFKCITDSLGSYCASRVFPGQPWYVTLAVSNQGDRPLPAWSYDVNLFQPSTGTNIPLVTQASGDSLPVGGFAQIRWMSPDVFDESQKGSDWRVDVHVSIKDSTILEPPERQSNNQSSWSFRVENPVPDIVLGFKCISDSAGYNCLNRVFTGEPWFVILNVYNSGDTPLRNWSYDIDLIDPGTGARIPLQTQVRGDLLPVGGYAQIRWASTFVFHENQEANDWRVEANVAIQDSSSPEPPDRQYNNRASWSFRVENPAAACIDIPSFCVTDTSRTCVAATTIHRPWHTLFTVVNRGDFTVNGWNFDIDLMRLPDSTLIPLARRIPGPPLPFGVRTTINWSSPHEFELGDIGKWEVILTAGADDSTGQDSSRARSRRSASLLVDIPTATLLSLFETRPGIDGLEIRWRFAEPREVPAVELERRDTPDGPWGLIASEPREVAGVWVVTDRNVQPGHTYHYRLVATTRSGERLVFGPLSGTTETAVAEFALSAVTPNPSRGQSRIHFVVPREAPVRLSIVDIQGREVALLAEGLQQPGEHQAIWNGRNARGDAPAGLYFVRYQTPDAVLVRRLAMTR